MKLSQLDARLPTCKSKFSESSELLSEEKSNGAVKKYSSPSGVEGIENRENGQIHDNFEPNTAFQCIPEGSPVIQGYERKNSLTMIDAGPKRLSEVEMDLGEMWNIRAPSRMSKSLRDSSSKASSDSAQKVQRLHALGRLFASRLSKISSAKKQRKPGSGVSKDSVATLAEGLKSDPNKTVPKRSSPIGIPGAKEKTDGSRSFADYKGLFVEPSNEDDDISWSREPWADTPRRKISRRKSTLAGFAGGSSSSRRENGPSATPLEKKVGYAGMAPLVSNVLKSRIYRKSRSMSFTNRRERSFLGHNRSRSNTFFKEFEMDPCNSNSSRSSRSIPKSSSSIEKALDRRSDFEKKALEYTFSVENLRDDRESYLAYKKKLHHAASFRTTRSNEATRFGQNQRSHSFTMGLPEINEEVLAPHPNQNNTTNDNIQRRNRRMVAT